jgi:hypothetical protein
MSPPFDDRGRYVDDEGKELNPDLVPKPSWCLSCAKDDNGDPEEEVLCHLSRLDRQEEPEFRCYAYESKNLDGIT